MVAGDKSIIWLFFSKILPPLSLSRFPSSDYRVFIAITIIILSISVLKNLVERIFQQGIIRNYWKYTFIACLCIALGIKFGIYTKRVLPAIDSPIRQETIAFLQAPVACIITIGLIAILYRAQFQRVGMRQTQQKSFILLLISLLVVTDGARVIWDMLPMWFIPNSDAKYAGTISLTNNHKLITYSIFKNLPANRPPRETTDHYLNLSWKGYLNGSYMMQDYGGTVLKNRQTIEANGIYTKYMFMAWKPVLIETKSQKKIQSFNIKDEFLKNLINQSTSIKDDRVVQTKYGINDIYYQVKLNEETIMLENEIFFPGWSSIIITNDTKEEQKDITLKAIPINEVFRGWVLPSGNYVMKASYNMPYWQEFLNFSLLCLMIWLTLVVKYLILMHIEAKHRVS